MTRTGRVRPDRVVELTDRVDRCGGRTWLPGSMRAGFRDYVRTTTQRDVVELSGIREVRPSGLAAAIHLVTTGLAWSHNPTGPAGRTALSSRPP
ncbi:MAG: hypothetical protein ACYCU5_08965 [Actinomycetes bacterium]